MAGIKPENPRKGFIFRHAFLTLAELPEFTGKSKTLEELLEFEDKLINLLKNTTISKIKNSQEWREFERLLTRAASRFKMLVVIFLLLLFLFTSYIYSEISILVPVIIILGALYIYLFLSLKLKVIRGIRNYWERLWQEFFDSLRYEPSNFKPPRIPSSIFAVATLDEKELLNNFSEFTIDVANNKAFWEKFDLYEGDWELNTNFLYWGIYQGYDNAWRVVRERQEELYHNYEELYYNYKDNFYEHENYIDLSLLILSMIMCLWEKGHNEISRNCQEDYMLQFMIRMGEEHGFGIVWYALREKPFKLDINTTPFLALIAYLKTRYGNTLPKRWKDFFIDKLFVEKEIKKYFDLSQPQQPTEEIEEEAKEAIEGEARSQKDNIPPEDQEDQEEHTVMLKEEKEHEENINQSLRLYIMPSHYVLDYYKIQEFFLAIYTQTKSIPSEITVVLTDKTDKRFETNAEVVSSYYISLNPSNPESDFLIVCKVSLNNEKTNVSQEVKISGITWNNKEFSFNIGQSIKLIRQQVDRIIFAIDFGTANTAIAYRTEGGVPISSDTIDFKVPLWICVYPGPQDNYNSNSSLETIIEENLWDLWTPYNRTQQHNIFKFPQPTGIWRLSNDTTPYISCGIFTQFPLLPIVNGITSNFGISIKWGLTTDTNIYLESLLYLIAFKCLEFTFSNKDGSNTKHQVEIRWMNPLSMDDSTLKQISKFLGNEAWDITRKIYGNDIKTYVLGGASESYAPVWYTIQKKTGLPKDKTALFLDIGASTVDLFLFSYKESTNSEDSPLMPIAAESFPIGFDRMLIDNNTGNSLWLDFLQIRLASDDFPEDLPYSENSYSNKYLLELLDSRFKAILQDTRKNKSQDSVNKFFRFSGYVVERLQIDPADWAKLWYRINEEAKTPYIADFVLMWAYLVIYSALWWTKELKANNEYPVWIGITGNGFRVFPGIGVRKKILEAIAKDCIEKLWNLQENNDKIKIAIWLPAAETDYKLYAVKGLRDVDKYGDLIIDNSIYKVLEPKEHSEKEVEEAWLNMLQACKDFISKRKNIDTDDKYKVNFSFETLEIACPDPKTISLGMGVGNTSYIAKFVAHFIRNWERSS